MNSTSESSPGRFFAEPVRVVSNEPFAADTWKIALYAPAIAEKVRPGQFAMLRLPTRMDPLLGRPFAVYDAQADSGRVEFIYLVVGKMTRLLTGVSAGETLELTGPMGNGWSAIEGLGVEGAEQNGDAPLPFERLVMVAGGVGQTPFYLLAKKYARRAHSPKMTLLYGARSKERLVPLADFERLGVETRVATEDGSAGAKGYVTDLLEPLCGSGTLVAACGPKPMLAAAYRAVSPKQIPCYVSLESPMCCGLGICYGCVVDYRADDGSWDYRRTCADGPVFDAYRLRWE